MRRTALVLLACALLTVSSSAPAGAVKPSAEKRFDFDRESYAATIFEGEHAAISVMRTHTKGPARVDLVLSNGSAQDGSDFTAETITLTFPNGAAFALVQFVPTIEDNVAEGPETFVASLANPTKGYSMDGDYVITITDDDAAP